MNWFALFLGGIVVFRISLLFAKEDGPAFIFRKIRKLPPPKSSAKDGLSCIFCVSIAASALVTYYEWAIGLIATNLTPLYWLAMSSLAIFANQTFTKGKL